MKIVEATERTPELIDRLIPDHGAGLTVLSPVSVILPFMYAYII